jgi:molybdopterin synthase sulfur carrier subunit
VRVRIGYYAILREQRGLSEEEVETAAVDAQGLYAELQARHGFSLRQDQLRVVVNDTFVAWDTALRGGEAVVFIPPVAGG